MENKAFWHKTIKLQEWQLDIVAIIYIVLGIVIGIFLVAAGGITSIFADIQTSIAKDTDADLAAGTLVSTEVAGTGTAAVVQLNGGSADWADANWIYRRPITVSSGYGSVLTEYQVMVTLTTGNFSYANVKAGCADIRFGDTNGNFLDYYQLACDTGGTSQFWVKTSSLAAGGNTTIYVYYGNAAATSASSMASTFSYSAEKTVGYALHDQVNSLNVISLEDGNSISHNGSTLTLDDGQTGSFSSINTSGAITATKLFNAHDPSDDTDAFVPVSFAGTELLATSRSASSGTEEFFLLSPWGTASVTIYADGGSCYTNAALGSTVVSTGTSCNAGDGTTYRIVSDIPILAFMDENTTDPYPLHPSDTGPWYGIGGSRATFSSGSAGSSVTYYRSDQASSSNLNIAADRDGEVSGLSSYGAGPAFKATGTNPITGDQWADGNGGDGAIFLPWYELGTKFGSATTMDYVAIAAPTAATCTTYNSAGGLANQATLSSANTEVYSLGLGTGNSNTYISTSWSMVCDAPVYAYFEKANDSESNVWSYPQMRQFVYPTPAVASVGVEEGALSPTGTWESATDANVIDLVWNGGWGDGTGSSTAFLATVANVGANANIVFQMRTADSVANLTGASYVVLGTANSGTTFSLTKDDMDLLSLATGVAGRYAQVKATLNSTNGIDNPQLDNFTIYYLADDTAPATNASAIQLFRTLTGAEVLPTEWTNNAAAYFTWSAGSDTQSGVRGYCLYLGTDP
ncbi:DUF2341 domain-containing protein, partial [Candidatus Dojkabacteria bacterium]|nr:DUF2341 domain-containing protein [Candidatus Dojkabacteria bacterium]